jgi:uncharacterized protein YaeQ
MVLLAAPTALESIVHKPALQTDIADIDRQLHADHALTLALHPSETGERLLMCVLAFALRVPQGDAQGRAGQRARPGPSRQPSP